MILDGWGIGDGSEADVISRVPTPEIDSLIKENASSKLLAAGEAVGLPDGQMGNSEVGHLNIGAGRVVHQDLVKINRAIDSGDFESNETLVNAFEYAASSGCQVHFMGLLSDGGVHSSLEHLFALCDMTAKYQLEKVFVHGFGDGRDTDPRSGKGYMKRLLDHIEGSSVRVASFAGRYYAMDRDKRWERIKRAYDMLVHGRGEMCSDILQAIEGSYEKGVTDESVEPLVVTAEGGENPVATIGPDDVVIFFNFRNDRARELTMALTQKDMPEHGMTRVPLHYCTMTPYDVTFSGVNVIFNKDNVENTIGEVLGRSGKSQLRIAETEKYAHVTFFFSGGREEPFEKEDRILVPSPEVATYDLKPEMSAPEVTVRVCEELERGEHDFICLNFANGDMVGHTGVYEAICKAVAVVDECAGRVVATAVKSGYDVIIISDHGNADYARNGDGSPNTAHSMNPVPMIVVSDSVKSVRDGLLADVAPTILTLMGIDIPEEMSGTPLIETHD